MYLPCLLTDTQILQPLLLHMREEALYFGGYCLHRKGILY